MIMSSDSLLALYNFIVTLAIVLCMYHTPLFNDVTLEGMRDKSIEKVRQLHPQLARKKRKLEH